MAESVKIVAQKRDDTGTRVARRLRKKGLLPCILCGTDGKTTPVQTNLHELEMILRHHGEDNLLADLLVDEMDARKTLLKELQYDPIKGTLLHADFLEISMTKKISVEIPIELVGEPTGVAQQGGVLDQVLRTLEVECLPGDIVESLPINVEALDVGDSLTVQDVPIDLTKFTLLTPKDLVVATVLAPTLEEVAEVEAEVTADDSAEPELIREKKEDGEEAGEDSAAEEKPKKKE